MPTYAETARAKINLTLRVLGRREDGFHALLSLVAFADAADSVTLDTEHPAAVTVSGPFAGAIAGTNLADETLRLVGESAPGLVLGHVTLEKRLPVAAGLGGGSSDAAAVLRLLRQAHHRALESRIDWDALAGRLGADVPVCLKNVPAWMSGAGERIDVLAQPLPPLAAVLVNPMVPVPADKTARVFRTLGAPSLAGGLDVASAWPAIPDRGELLALLARTGNDLEAPATAVVPEIGDVLDRLEACPGLEVARLSGAGPTCFGIFADSACAEAAAAAIAADAPGWWVIATTIR